MSVEMSVEMIELIVTRLERRGRGEEHSPIRIITQYWDKDGNLIFENDPCSRVVKIEEDFGLESEIIKGSDE